MGLTQWFKWLIVPSGVSLNASTASLWNWATYQLIPTITPVGSINKKIHWTSSNTSRATVDENWLVTGTGDGSVTVTATTDYGNYTDSCTFTVYTVHVTWITLNESEFAMSVWDTLQLEATITPENATNKNVTRRSTDTSIATVDSNWLVTYIDDGECQIIATTVDGSYTATCDILPWLPGIYQQVEWIQASNSQYIDTLVYPTNKTKVDFKISNWSQTWSHQIFWEDRNWSSWDWGFSIVTDAYHFNWPVSCSHWMNNWAVHIWEYSQQWLYVDWVLKATPATTTFTASNTMTIFCLNRNGSKIEFTDNKLYYFNIYEDWNLIREFIPCYRKSDWVIWFYDKVNKEFYTNQGSWTFTKGNDVNIKLKDFNELEYIQSSWTQWIDTGVIPTSNTLSQIKFINLAATWDVIYWMYNWNDNADYRFFNASSTMYFDLNSSRIQWSSVVVNTLYELEIGNNYVKNVWASSNILSWNTVSWYTGSTTIKLNRSGNWAISQNKWYYVKIQENWELVRDFMPARRKSDWTIWMIDKVNMAFYTNNWSWDFTAWPDV